ncbi:MAG: HEAT repeat domain-containing protein [Planctomycetes bacterium]|nr:HEAT repeat domain-containing protein [Planctomycetota bacterium]
MTMVLSWLILLAPPMLGQRPTSAEDALAKFQAARERGDAARRRALEDLGEFPDRAVTELLLRELNGATDPGYRQQLARAIGQHPRDGAVPVLVAALRRDANPRLLEVLATALAAQQEPGATALLELLDEAGQSRPLRQAVLTGLGRSPEPAARERVLAEARTAAGRDRLPALRALGGVTDPAVDELRVVLAGDSDLVVAGAALAQCADGALPRLFELAEALHRRCPATAPAEVHAAVLRGLLPRPSADIAPAIVLHAAHGDDPFGKSLRSAWTAAVANEAFFGWLLQQGSARKPPAERAVVATALGLAPETHRRRAATVLAQLATDKEAAVVAASVDALSALGGDVGGAALWTLLERGPAAARVPALAALVTLLPQEPRTATAVAGAAAGRDLRLRTAALQLLARLVPPPTNALALAHDDLDHAAWPVRAAAISACRAMRQAASIPLLFGRLEHERDRLREDLLDALADLTGLRYPHLAAWQEWWQKAGPRFEVPPRAAEPDEDGDRPRRRNRDRDAERPAVAAGTVSYWNIPVVSTRVLFVVDVSGSMNQPFGTGSTRIDEARRQLLRVLESVPAGCHGNVIAFGNGARGFAEKLQPLDQKRRAAWRQQIEGLTVGGATDVHAALQLAFADADVDTIFLLTDGQPSAGAITAPDALADAVASWNLTRQIRIHTIALGGRSAFLARLAADSGGIAQVAR